MKVRSVIIGAVVVSAICVAGCSNVVNINGTGVRGSGTLTTEVRDVSGFDQVTLLGTGKVTIDVTGTDSLTIEAEDNIMPLLTSDIRNGTLELGSEQNISPTRTINYTITVASLSAVTVSGSASVTVTDVEADTFTTDIAGSGSVEVFGTADTLEVTISGSGSFAGEDLEAVDGSVEISGSGNVVVFVTGSLDARITGSGNIEYLGDPDVAQSITGSGSIRHG